MTENAVVVLKAVHGATRTPSRTRSRAWLLGDRTPVVMVEGYPGAVALTHVSRLTPPADPREQGGER